MSPSIARRAFNLLMNAKVDVNVKSSDNSIEYNLTEREKEILLKLIDGLEYKEIALELDASPNTIRNHVTKIYKNLHVTSRAQAMKLFRKS
jgi:DNA-binding NarL/FixJ family response regulator